MKLTWSDIAKALGIDNPCPERADALITEISTDTRCLPPGCLFLALRGKNFDGHDFLERAFQAGAAAVVCETPVKGREERCFVVKDTGRALLDIAGYYRRKLPVRILAVTGSVGKTTTKELAALALSARYETRKTEGNLNNEIGMPKTLLGLDETAGAAVIEMGMSGFGEIRRMSVSARPDAAVITNIGFSHMERLGSQEGILRAKLEILEGMPESAPLILNGDDRILWDWKEKGMTGSRPVYTFGIGNPAADVTAGDIVQRERLSFDIRFQGKRYPAEIDGIGRHYVLDALAAFTAAVLADVPPKAAAAKLSEYRPVGLRQRVERLNGQTVIIDCYNASPDSMAAALQALSQIQPGDGGRRVAVLADMLELGSASKALHMELGRMAVEAGVDKLVCYGEMARYTAAQADDMGLHTGAATDREMLLTYLQQTLRPGDAVLFKGSRGMRLEEIIEALYGVKLAH